MLERPQDSCIPWLCGRTDSSIYDARQHSCSWWLPEILFLLLANRMIGITACHPAVLSLVYLVYKSVESNSTSNAKYVGLTFETN